jgi:hypothetical protein
MFGLDQIDPSSAFVTSPIILSVDGQVLAQAVAKASLRRSSTK